MGVANLLTLRSMLLRMSCTHSALRHTKSSAATSTGRWSDHDSRCGYRATDGGGGEYNDDADVNRDGWVSLVDALMTMPSEGHSKSFGHSQKIERVIPMWNVTYL